MKLFSIFLSFFFLTIQLNAQSLEEVKSFFTEVNSLEQLEEIKEKYPDWYITDDKTLLSDSLRFPEIVGIKKGEFIQKQYSPQAPTFLVKVLEVDTEELCKAKYIYLDGSKYAKTQIDSLRKIIIQRYKKGEDFTALVKEYTMDGNPTGDLEWFYKGMMVEDFDQEVRKRKKGEIFTVDVNSNGWYYVVLKNYDNRTETAINGIKIKYDKAEETITFPLVLTEKHQLVAGTNIKIIPPTDFSLSESFKGFQNPEDPTSMIMIMEIPGPYQEVSGGFNEEMLAPAGMSMISKTEINIAGFDGLLLEVEQAANGLEFTKYILVYGDESETILINGAFLKDSPEIGVAIKQSILSTFIDTKIDANPREALNYSVDETLGGLLFHSVIGNAMLFNRDLKTPTESEDKVMLMVDKSYANVLIEDPKEFCISRIKDYGDDYSILSKKGIKEVEIDSLKGFELFAKNNDDTSEEMYQLILFDKAVGYYLFLGTYKKGSKKAIKDIKKVIFSFVRK